ncbi:hypothetical protein SDC9_125245 [bioreactor metagenome]|uniref:Uncharacterized protein n=1 Tax=bioreactor metagenome TaxID=1076179 RepID=A0A645CMX0_9ZZZZ
MVGLHRDHGRQPHAMFATSLVDAQTERILAVQRHQRQVGQIGQLHAGLLDARAWQQALGHDALHVHLGQ